MASSRSGSVEVRSRRRSTLVCLQNPVWRRKETFLARSIPVKAESEACSTHAAYAYVEIGSATACRVIFSVRSSAPHAVPESTAIIRFRLL